MLRKEVGRQESQEEADIHLSNHTEEDNMGMLLNHQLCLKEGEEFMETNRYPVPHTINMVLHLVQYLYQYQVLIKWQISKPSKQNKVTQEVRDF